MSQGPGAGHWLASQAGGALALELLDWEGKQPMVGLGGLASHWRSSHDRLGSHEDVRSSDRVLAC